MKKRRRLLMSPRHLAQPWRDPDLVLANASSCLLSSISSDNAVVDATRIIFPIKGNKRILRASCGELCCVEVKKSLYLWNPSINAYKKLPDPLLSSYKGENTRLFNGFEYIYGLGYDSVNDDYKLFRLKLNYGFEHKSELYSLKSDSWRMIDYPSRLGNLILPQKSVFVAGALHWRSMSKPIISFDLATEKYGKVAPPPNQELPPSPNQELPRREVSVLREKLCVHASRSVGLEFRLVIWFMEEYGNEKSWTKQFDINNCNGIPLDPDYGRMNPDYTTIIVMPLYLFDNGELLFRVCTYRANYALFLYKGEETRPWKMIRRGNSHGIVYEESPFSPLKLVNLNAAKKQDDLEDVF